MFLYQLTLDTLKLKKDNGIYYVLSWKAEGAYNSKLRPLYTAFSHSVKLAKYKIGMTSDKDPLPVQQNNYSSKILKVSIVYDLDAWPRNSNFKFKNRLFGATSVAKIVIKKSMCIVAT